jgi:hypothetical protein
MCGGPSNNQKQAQQQQENLSNTMSGIFKQNQAVVNPFATNLVNNGLPFMGALEDQTGGTLAQSYKPAYAQLARNTAAMGPLPSGFATQAKTDLMGNQAQAFDQQQIQNLLLNQQAKQQGAQMLNPLGFGTSAQQGYSSVMNAPVQPNPLGSILGGALGGAAMIPGL